MTIGEFFDNVWQALPVTDIIYHITKRPKGLSPHDYAGFACTADECRAIPAAAILRCKRDTARQSAIWIAEWVGISTAADFIKVIVGAIIAGVTAPSGIGIAVGAALAAIGVIDAAIVQDKANKIGGASVTAMSLYCVCGWQGPAAPPSTIDD